ncbi:hypothetical protein MTP41_10745 [Faecalibacterium sp. I4-3-84]|uniref:hypothetical protein n=1 Tax=Faecalibacterium sp. I4-3-84 TaxID=2929495 RepID=UPI002014FAAE|nr:hypothetical protein [Faecalibacterium sp. I4-3-84]UQK36367.1 hypothetical protein MTP41_10745 [Faecalibacterium sp. I4-3-84]
MKRWTRKLLAGLLSLGLLLQAASPLSALAAEDISGAAQVAPVSLLIVRDGDSDNYATVKYTLNHYADGRVSWENGKKPFEGIDVKYDTATSTFVFTGTLSLPESEKPFVNLTCTDPKTDSIKLDGNGDNAVGAALTVGFPSQTRGAKNITIVTDSSSSAAIRGYACLDCYGNVVIENPSGKVTGGATRTAEGVLVYGNAQNVTVTGDDSRFIISGDFSVYSKGDVTLTNPSGAITESYIRVAESAGDVKIEGSSSNGLAWLYGTTYDSTMIKAKTLTMKNNGGTVGKVVFTGADTTSAYRVAVGESESSNTQTALTDTNYSATVDAKYLNIQTGTPENTTVKHTLTLTNAKAYTDENHTVEADKNEAGIYSVAKGTKVYVVAEAPDNVSRWKFTGWEGSSETSENITVTVNENTTLTAKWEKVTDQATNYGITVTIGNNPPIEVTSENCGHILGVGNDKLTYDPDTHTLTGTGSFGKMKVEITDDLEDKVDVVLSNANGAVVNGSLTVTGAQDVKVTGVSSTALITGDATITCAGDILMDNTGSGNVLGYGDHGNLDVQSAQNVTIHGEGRTGTDEDGNNYTIYGRAEIECSGNVEITSQNGGAVWDPVVITKAANVTITANQRAVWDSRSYLDSSINCSGEVKITSKNAAALHDGKLTITGATDVTISGKRDEGATIGGDAEITCSGDVVLENKGTGAVVESKLVYTQSPAKGYEVKTGKNAESATVAYTDEEGTTSYTVPNTETNPETNPVPSYISITAVGTPPVVPGDDDFTGGDSGAGGAVAAVLVGGAAVWGGYEITTRVILHNILPEGAEIPANRGQLALLVWNTAGRPEPVNTPAFADVADADTAKAAQWCVEQGIMDAKSESTFKPEGWMPKFKTIEVWERAFPKQ